MQYLYLLLYSWTIILIAGISTLFSEASIFPESMLSIIFIALSPILYLLIEYVKNTSTIQLKLKRFSFFRVVIIMVIVTLTLVIFQPDFLTLSSICVGLTSLLFGTDSRIIFILGFIESICVIILLFFEQNIIAEYMLTQLFYVLLIGIIVTTVGTHIAEVFDRLLKEHESIVHGWKQKISILDGVDFCVKYFPSLLMLLSVFSVILSPIGDIYYVVIAVIYLFAFFATTPVITYQKGSKDMLFLGISSLSIFLIFFSYSLAEGVLAFIAYIGCIFLITKKRSVSKKFQLFFK